MQPLLWWDDFTGVAKCDYKWFAFVLNFSQKKLSVLEGFSVG